MLNYYEFVKFLQRILKIYLTYIVDYQLKRRQGIVVKPKIEQYTILKLINKNTEEELKLEKR